VSSYVGVSRNSNGGSKCWQARVWHSGKYNWLGNFHTEDSARDAVLLFKKKESTQAVDIPDTITDPVLPVQYLTGSKKNSKLEQEVTLRFAMLEQARRDIQSESPELRKSAVDWVLGIVDSPKTFSFKDICDLCEADEKKARKSLLNSYASSRY
jgi:hypothetical protein